jgi:CheY-like chemotaxis protein
MRESGPSTPEANQAVHPLKESKILLVEDESIVSMLVEDMLSELGCGEIWCVSSVRDALALLDERTPDAAVLDFNLRGETAIAVAERLEAAQIPFAFATGYGRSGIPGAWLARPVLQKPFKLEALADVLAALVAK